MGILKYHGGKLGYDLKNLVANCTIYHCSRWESTVCKRSHHPSACRGKEWDDLVYQVRSHGEEACYLAYHDVRVAGPVVNPKYAALPSGLGCRHGLVCVICHATVRRDVTTDRSRSTIRLGELYVNFTIRLFSPPCCPLTHDPALPFLRDLTTPYLTSVLPLETAQRRRAQAFSATTSTRPYRTVPVVCSVSVGIFGVLRRLGVIGGTGAGLGTEDGLRGGRSIGSCCAGLVGSGRCFAVGYHGGKGCHLEGQIPFRRSVGGVEIYGEEAHRDDSCALGANPSVKAGRGWG